MHLWRRRGWPIGRAWGWSDSCWGHRRWRWGWCWRWVLTGVGVIGVIECKRRAWVIYGLWRIARVISTCICPQHRIAIPIRIVHQRVRRLGNTRPRIPRPKPAAPHAVPAYPQPDIAALLQFARKAKRRNGRRLRDAPGIVASCCDGCASIIQGGPDAAKCIHTLPCACCALLPIQALSGIAIDGVLRAVGMLSIVA